MTNDNDNFWDFLSEREATYSEEAMRKLEVLPWAEPLLRTIRTNGGLTTDNMPFLFEARFANALFQAGVTPEYEVPGEGASTIDLRFSYQGQVWQVELMRLHETQAARNAIQIVIDGGIQWFLRQLSTNAEDKRQSEEGETVQAVQHICQKCEKNRRPYKFPVPDRELNVLLVDFRTFLHGGDVHDRIHVGLGGEYVNNDFYRRYWDGELISGVFNEHTPVRGAEFIRHRVHYLGFVDEKEFRDGGFAEAIQFIANPYLFVDNVGQAKGNLQNWPLQPAFLINS